jgi:hypothetical protein
VTPREALESDRDERDVDEEKEEEEVMVQK